VKLLPHPRCLPLSAGAARPEHPYRTRPDTWPTPIFSRNLQSGRATARSKGRNSPKSRTLAQSRAEFVDVHGIGPPRSNKFEIAREAELLRPALDIDLRRIRSDNSRKAACNSCHGWCSLAQAREPFSAAEMPSYCSLPSLQVSPLRVARSEWTLPHQQGSRACNRASIGGAASVPLDVAFSPRAQTQHAATARTTGRKCYRVNSWQRLPDLRSVLSGTNPAGQRPSLLTLASWRRRRSVSRTNGATLRVHEFYEGQIRLQILARCLHLVLRGIHFDGPQQTREGKLGELPLPAFLV